MTTGRERYGDDFGAAQMWGLQETPLPEPVSWWPQTPGWLLFGFLVAMVLGGWLRYRVRAWRRDAWRREAIAQLAAIRDDAARRAELPRLLRRAALVVAPRREVAGLRGAQWVRWLNTHAGKAIFLPDDAERLDAMAYGPGRDDAESRALAERCLTWLRGRHARI